MSRIGLIVAIIFAPFWAIAAEYLENASSASAWKLETRPGNGALRNEDGALRIDVQTATPQAWDVQFFQDGKTLMAGRRYVLRFSARASTPRSINIAGQLREPPFKSFWFQGNVQIGTAYRSYEYAFTPDRDTNGKGGIPMFIVGANAGALWFKDVSLRDAADKPATPTTRSSTTGPFVTIPGSGSGSATPQGAGAVAVTFKLEAINGARAGMSPDAGGDRIDIQQLGPEIWTIKMYQVHENMRPGRYEIAFFAKADRARPIDILPAQEHTEPYTRLTGAATVQLSTNWQKYVAKFELPASTKPIRTPTLILGAATGTVWVKDCTLTPIP